MTVTRERRPWANHYGRQIIFTGRVNKINDISKKQTWAFMQGKDPLTHVLISHITFNGQSIDHVWLRISGKALQEEIAGLQSGHTVEIRGIVHDYVRGDGSIDYSVDVVGLNRRCISTLSAGYAEQLLQAVKSFNRSAKPCADSEAECRFGGADRCWWFKVNQHGIIGTGASPLTAFESFVMQSERNPSRINTVRLLNNDGRYYSLECAPDNEKQTVEIF